MDSEHPQEDTSPVTARRSALKKLGVGAAAVWVAPAITTGASAGQVASPPPGPCVSTEAELVAALAAATDRATIVLCETTITLTAELVIDKDVTLQGQGPGVTTLSGGGTNLLLQVDPGRAVTLDTIGITGRGIENNGTLTMTDCTVDGAATDLGSAVLSSGVLEATNTIFSNNSSPAFGGAIRTSGGTVTLSACTFTGNSAGIAGGAVRLSDTTATITNCAFVGNSAVNDGGAISAAGTSTFTTPGCAFVSNTANPALGAGGAVEHSASGTYTVGAATFTANIAAVGTAIYRGSNPINLAGITLGPGQTVVDP